MPNTHAGCAEQLSIEQNLACGCIIDNLKINQFETIKNQILGGLQLEKDPHMVFLADKSNYHTSLKQAENTIKCFSSVI